MRKGAVVTHIATELRQWNEHLARVGHARSEALPRERFGALHQWAERCSFQAAQRIDGLDAHVASGILEYAMQARVRCSHGPRSIAHSVTTGQAAWSTTAGLAPLPCAR